MTATAQKSHNQFGALPVWDLSDLYPGKDSPQFKADLEKAKADAARFETEYKGKLVELTKAGKLINAIKDSEKLGDLTGKIGSFSFLQYAYGNQPLIVQVESDSVRGVVAARATPG